MRRSQTAVISASTPREFLIAILIVLAAANMVFARVVVLKNGMEISGDTATVPSIGQELLAVGAGDKGKSVVVVNDGLRRSEDSPRIQRTRPSSYDAKTHAEF